MCNKFCKIYFLNFFSPIFTLKKRQQQVLILESNSQSQANNEMALPCTTWLKRSNSKSHRTQCQFLALLRSSSLHCLKLLIYVAYVIKKTKRRTEMGQKGVSRRWERKNLAVHQVWPIPYLSLPSTLHGGRRTWASAFSCFRLFSTAIPG